ncbi:UPF0262 family protein [Prosthecomicrobium sp. N25]|uniref:UPF0262 family protein n=1 Tax=Prosthecomicrobium sp. N25 TaxID=3129254 RepID=UPI003077AFD7
MEEGETRPGARLVEVVLDENSIARSTPDVEHERAVAIYDLIEENVFAPHGHDGGPYRLRLSLVESKMMLEISDTASDGRFTHILSLTPFRKIVKDYFLVCESYYAAIRTASPGQIEAIDMGRRGLHNEGSRVLMERLADKVAMDFDTARRLFTLVCALHWKG